MIKITFASIEELAEFMIYCMDEQKYTVAAIHFTGAKALMRELLSYSEIDISLIELENDEWFDYDSEYYVSLAPDGFLGVEKAYCEGHYLNTCADVLLISSDASYELMDERLAEGVLYEFDIDELASDEFDDDFEKDDNEVDGDIHIEVELPDEFSSAELILDEHHNVIGAKVRSDELFDYLFNI